MQPNKDGSEMEKKSVITKVTLEKRTMVVIYMP
jgi:hypothetical protein